jgi:hypothetical protein
MRLSLAFLLFFLGSSLSSAWAQSSYYVEQPHLEFEGGLIFGTNFTQIDGDTYSGYHNVGLNTGALVYIHFTQRWGISMELLYSQKGSRSATTVNDPNLGLEIQQYGIQLNYAEIPLMVHYRQKVALMENPVLTDFELGFSYSRLISSSEWAYMSQPFIINPSSNYFNNTDIEGVIGIATKLYKNLHVNFRYQYSLTTIRPASRVPLGFSYGDGQYNNVCVLRLIYYFSHHTQED